MKKQLYISSLFIIAIAWWLGCKKPYNPSIVVNNNNYLVVEANINTGSDSTLIRLSRTVPVSSNSSATPETGAVVSILSDGGATYPVVEKGNGYYMCAPINAAAPAKYSIKISTKNGETYQSDFVSTVNSPPIDSVYYRVQSSGLSIYLDTHDPTNTAQYYLWNYTDTYVFHTEFSSTGIVVKVPQDTILFRPPADQIYQCWHNDTSSSILTGSTAKLARAVISQEPILSLPSTSVKLTNRFSIQVNQYALTSDAFNYYQLLKQNTQDIGSIFDPQPSELPSNIHCLSNPSEAVIGYITAGTPTKARIFIDVHNLPDWIPDNPYSACLLDSAYYLPVPQHNLVSDVFYNGYETPVLPISGRPDTPPIGWSGSSPLCVDCTLNGTNVRPIFWTDYAGE